MTIRNVSLLVVLVACAGFILSLRAQNPKDAKSVEGLTVVDSKEVTVGKVLGFGTNIFGNNETVGQPAPGLYPVVGLRVKGRLVLLATTTFGFTSFTGGPIADAGAGGGGTLPLPCSRLCRCTIPPGRPNQFTYYGSPYFH